MNTKHIGQALKLCILASLWLLLNGIVTAATPINSEIQKLLALGGVQPKNPQKCRKRSIKNDHQQAERNRLAEADQLRASGAG